MLFRSDTNRKSSKHLYLTNYNSSVYVTDSTDIYLPARSVPGKTFFIYATSRYDSKTIGINVYAMNNSSGDKTVISNWNIGNGSSSSDPNGVLYTITCIARNIWAYTKPVGDVRV